MPELTEEFIETAERHKIHLEQEEARYLIHEARRSRRRTIFMSIIASGLVTLFIGRTVDVSISNGTVSRGRDNCSRIQEDRALDSRQLRVQAAADGRQADNVLGNPRKHIEPFKLKGSAFEEFAPLILAQARQSRRKQMVELHRAQQYTNRIEDCNKVYPKQHVIPFLHFT